MNMDQQEQVIADKIKSETGFDTHIRIHDDEEIAFQQKLGYLTPFLFSEEIDGQTYFYTVENSPLTTVEYSHAETKQPDPEAPYSSKSYSDWLFPKFYFRGSQFSMYQFSTLSIRGTTIPHFGEDPFLTIPFPPPETA